MSSSAKPALPPYSLRAQLYSRTPRYAVGVVLLLIYAVGQFGIFSLTERSVNEAIQGDTSRAFVHGLQLMGVAAVVFVVRILSRIAIFNAGRLAEFDLRNMFLERLHQLGPSFYGRMASGDLLSRATADLTQVRLLLGFAVLNVASTLFLLASSLTYAFSKSWKLTLASLATIPVLLFVTRGFGKEMFSRTRANQDAVGRLSDLVQNSLTGVRVVRSFALEGQELERFKAANQEYLEANLSLSRLRGSMGPIFGSVSAVGMLIVFWYGGQLVIWGEMKPGALLAFFVAFAQLTWPLLSLGFVVAMVQRGRAAFARLEEVFEAEPDIEDGPLPKPETVEGRLSVRHLSFSYGDHGVLKDVSFELPRGKSVAVVGRTGSGKSTLASLLPRLSNVPRGAVFLDDVDVCDLPLATVRSTVGYAQQTAFLFSTTVARNIGYTLADPDSEASHQRVVEAARDAAILGDIEGLKDGFDTVVGERGVQLSGGQKQRSALARAFVYEPKILVLDDPLSAVDARTEASILEALDKQRAARSLVLVTHRVAAASRCDEILVLEDGRVSERGSHDELIAQGGLYASFAEEQRVEAELAQLGAADLEAIRGLGSQEVSP